MELHRKEKLNELGVRSQVMLGTRPRTLPGHVGNAGNKEWAKNEYYNNIPGLRQSKNTATGKFNRDGEVIYYSH